jgi:hypothetical protein
MRGGRLIQRDNLVAGGEDRYFGPRDYGDRSMPSHRECCNMTGVDRDSFGDQYGALMCLRTLVIDELAAFSGAIDLQLRTVSLDVLYHHHCIGTFRHWRTSHDFERFSCFQGFLASFTGPHFTAHVQCSRHLGGFDCETIAQRTPERGVIAIRCDGVGQNASVRFFQQNVFPLPPVRQEPDSFDYNSSSFIKLECWTFHR